MAAHAALLAEIALEMRETALWTGRETLSQPTSAALAKVPRVAFVLPGSEEAAYVNRPLPIGFGQTISQPFIVALMTELLDLQPEHKVLEIGTGSGYQTAVLAELVSKVCSIEVIPELACRAAEVLAMQGYRNVALRTGDGTCGWPEQAPFDAIIVTAAAPEIPPALTGQLRLGGKMMIPVGPRYGDQELVLVAKKTSGEVVRHGVLPVAFVPLTSG